MRYFLISVFVLISARGVAFDDAVAAKKVAAINAFVAEVLTSALNEIDKDRADIKSASVELSKLHDAALPRLGLGLGLS